MTRPARILCIDDNRLMAEALERWLQRRPEFQWTGWRDACPDSLELISTLAPDIILLDVDIPGSDTFAFVARLSAECPSVKVVMFSGHLSIEHIDHAVDAGAWGYLSKSDPMDEVLRGLRRVLAGEFVLSADAAIEADGRDAAAARPHGQLSKAPESVRDRAAEPRREYPRS